MKTLYCIALAGLISFLGYGNIVTYPLKTLIDSKSAENILLEVDFLNDLPANHPPSDLSMDVIDYQLFQLDVQAVNKIQKEKPALISFNIPNTDISVRLARVDNITSDFFIETSGGLTSTQKSFEKGVFYRGIVNSPERSVVAFSFYEGSLMGIISTVSRGNLVMGALKDDPNTLIFYNDRDLLDRPVFECADKDIVSANTRNSDPSDNGTAQQTDKCVRMYLECDNAMFTFFGSNVNNTVQYTQGLFNMVSALYFNESINLQLSEIYVWTTPDFYPENRSDSSLYLFGQRIQDNFNGDLGHLLSTAGNNRGGIGWKDVFCLDYIPSQMAGRYAYSNINTYYSQVPVYSWSVEVVAHETGHNFGSTHTQSCTWPGGPIDNCRPVEDGTCPAGPTPVNGGTIMSYCHLTSNGINLANGFGLLPGNRIRLEYQNASCLSTCSAASYPDIVLDKPANIDSISAVGERINYELKLENNGYTTASQFSFDAEMVVNPLNPPVKLISINVDSITVNNYKIYTFGFNIPSNISPGTYQINFCADPSNLVTEMNENNNCFSYNMKVGTTTGIHTYSENPGLKVYPIPNNGTFYIENDKASGQVDLEIWDVLGRQIFHKQSDLVPGNKIEINELQAYPAGNYILVMKNDNFNTQQKIIKQ